MIWKLTRNNKLVLVWVFTLSIVVVGCNPQEDATVSGQAVSKDQSSESAGGAALDDDAVRSPGKQPLAQRTDVTLDEQVNSARPPAEPAVLPRESQLAIPIQAASDESSPATGDRAAIQLASFAETATAENSPAADDDRQEELPLQFEDWPRPELALFITGRQFGYIEPCGCTGLENAKGGLSRRHAALQRVRQRNFPILAVDVGNQVRRFGRQAELKFQTTVDTMRLMGYQGIGFGPDDLRLSIGELIAAVAESDGGASPFVSANVDLLGQASPYRIVNVGRRRVGVTSILGKEHVRDLQIDEIELSDPIEALRTTLEKFREERCELRVLLVHASLEETREIVRKFPEIEVVVTAGGADEPTLEPERVPGCKAYIVQVGNKGMHVGVLGVFLDKSRPIRYERVVLDSRFGESQEVLGLFAAYQKQLEALGWDGLDLRPLKHPFARSSTGQPRTFVGHDTCADCHTNAFAVFEETPHFHTTQTISEPTQRSNIPRHFDPECISCHVTGWDPQGNFPYESGYVSYEESTHLHSIGCESCHGPGSAHVAAENGDIDVTDPQLKALREEMRLTLADAKQTKCFECHDLDNSPAFQQPGAFEEYWEEVKHHGMD